MLGGGVVEAVALCVAGVHDGDTLNACDGERIRIENIDAPEVRGSPLCHPRRPRRGWCDYEMGERSRDVLKAFLAGRNVAITRTGIDRYGRTLARVSVNGVDAGDYLISRRLARPWQ